MPPPLLRNPSAPESLEGERILYEYSGETGLLLWLCYRDVRLWADTPPRLRGELFDAAGFEQQREWLEGARLDPETRRAVSTLLRAVLRRSTDDGSMVSAALSIAAGAERAGASGTATAYTQLAASTSPISAAPALAVGQLAARFGYLAMAETWLRRTVGLARRSEEWEAYGAALTELGRLRESSGRLREARMEYRSALRLARRKALYMTLGRAVSGLLRVALGEDDLASAVRYGRSTLRYHRRDHPDRGSVLLDVAELELRRGGHERAFSLLREALPSRIDTVEQVRALTMLVRAAGGVGDGATVQETWHRAVELIDAVGTCGDGVRMLLALARAGAEVLEEAHADVVAYRALAWAARLNEPTLTDECTAFLARPRFPSGGVVNGVRPGAAAYLLGRLHPSVAVL